MATANQAIETNETAIARSKNNVHKLVLNKHVHPVVHGDGPLGRFNTFIAVHITKTVGSMWCAYAFTLLALISLPAAIASQNPIIIVSWIAQTFLQLVLLPIIIVGQNVQAAASDARAESDHETLLAIYTLTHEVHTIAERQTKMLKILEDRTVNLDTSEPSNG
ncbi:MAG TPA: hypothetical protein VKQ72_10255 [Aggregatilineales bacterium]|nr:hypothetical protein [Aggregatilineales bacterium]